MAGDDLAGVAGELARILGESGLLIGGLAVSTWGHVRATEDMPASWISSGSFA